MLESVKFIGAAFQRNLQCRAGSLNQKGAQVGIATPADMPKFGLASTAVLPRCQPKPSGELATILEIERLTNSGRDGICGKRSDAADLLQALAVFRLTRRESNGAVAGREVLVQLLELSLCAY